MKIVQISSLWETTPPPKYGGLELVVSNLTEELVKRGHEVTLFATGDSKTSAKLVSTYPKALYRDDVSWSSMYDTLLHVGEAIKYAKEINADVIHNHQSHRSLAMMSLTSTPFVNTIHGTLQKDLIPADRLRSFDHYKDQNYVSISNFQRKHGPDLNWMANAYNGIDASKFDYNDKPVADYLFWIGRFTKTKAPHLAIEIAKKAGMKLLMAAKLDEHVEEDKKYFEEVIKPQLKDGEVEWVGEIGHEEKVKLYKDALALVNPIQWDEPFGLVVVESMACGTPVISYERGSMEELITDGKDGFLIKPNDIEGFVEAVGKVKELNREDCRKKVEEHFSVEAMTDSYLEAYKKAIESR